MDKMMHTYKEMVEPWADFLVGHRIR